MIYPNLFNDSALAFIVISSIPFSVNIFSQTVLIVYSISDKAIFIKFLTNEYNILYLFLSSKLVIFLYHLF